MDYECFSHHIGRVFLHHKCICIKEAYHRLGASNVPSIIKDENDGIIITVSKSLPQGVI